MFSEPIDIEKIQNKMLELQNNGNTADEIIARLKIQKIRNILLGRFHR